MDQSRGPPNGPQTKIRRLMQLGTRDLRRESALPRGIKQRVTVEAGSPIGWHRWAGDEGSVIGVERFGASAPGQEVLAHLGFTPDHVAAAALKLLGKEKI